jgi:IclR family transcriptional regulator, pca regulon regulatory protein
VQSLERGLAVVRAFDAEHPERTLSDVARKTGLTRAAARRFLLTLADLGYVRSDGRNFSLTPRVLDLGYAYLSSLELPEIAEPHLERLVEEVHESSSVSVLDGDDVVYVARVSVSRIMRVAINVGTRFPAHVTSMGRVLLAAGDPVEWPEALRPKLEAVRRQGWALVDQELELGLRSVAAPVQDAERRTVAALNVSAAVSRVPLATLREEILPSLLRTADAVSTALGRSARSDELPRAVAGAAG